MFSAAQPALLYLVPFTLLPLVTMAYLKVSPCTMAYLKVSQCTMAYLKVSQRTQDSAISVVLSPMLNTDDDE